VDKTSVWPLLSLLVGLDAIQSAWMSADTASDNVGGIAATGYLAPSYLI